MQGTRQLCAEERRFTRAELALTGILAGKGKEEELVAGLEEEEAL